MKQINVTDYVTEFEKAYYRNHVFSHTFEELSVALGTELNCADNFERLFRRAYRTFLAALLEDETFLKFPLLGIAPLENGCFFAFAESGYAECECGFTLPIYTGFLLEDDMCGICTIAIALQDVYDDDDAPSIGSFAKMMRTGSNLFDMRPLC